MMAPRRMRFLRSLCVSLITLGISSSCLRTSGDLERDVTTDATVLITPALLIESEGGELVERALPTSGRLLVTAYETERKDLSSTESFDLSLGAPFELQLNAGSWRVMLTIKGAPLGSYYGVSATQELKRGDSRELRVLIGREGCAGLAPATTGAENMSLDLPRGSVGSAALAFPNGLVLISGGMSVNSEGEAEQLHDRLSLFDPSTGLITLSTQTMSIPRARHRADLLDNGQILLTGGYTALNGGMKVPTSTAELIKLTPEGDLEVTALSSDLGVARAQHATTKLKSGHILITGGLGPSDEYLRSAVSFDPESEQFYQQGDLVAPRAFHTVTLLDGPDLAIVIGGLNDEGPIKSTEVLGTKNCEGSNDSLGCFRLSVPLLQARFGHVALKSSAQYNTIMVAGGFFEQGDASEPSLIELFSLERDVNGTAQLASSSIGELSEPRAFPSGARLIDDHMILAGGLTFDQQSISEILSVKLNFREGGSLNAEISELCPLSEARSNAHAVLLSEGGVALIGGSIQEGRGQYKESRRIELLYPAPPVPAELFLD